MTRKERFERAIRCEEVDRLPFWVKVFGASYRNLQQPRYRDMPELELADFLDLEHMAGGPVPVRCINEKVTTRTEKQNGTTVTWTETPDGTLRSANTFDPSSHSSHPTEFAIKTLDDLRAMRHCYDSTTYEFQSDVAEKTQARLKEVGDRGIVTGGMGVSPLMSLIQHLIGPEKTYYFMADHPDEMDELIELMHQDRLRCLRFLVEYVPYDYVFSTENTSTTLMSPAMFEKYPWQHLTEYARITTDHGKTHLLHMCGKLKALLPKIDELKSAAIEAYTSPPVGDTTIADRVALCPHTAIIGGTNATTWLRPAEGICSEIEKGLDEAGTIRGCVLTCAGVMPPAASLEKIAEVREFAKGITWERFERN